jgi:hypothetical protein
VLIWRGFILVFQVILTLFELLLDVAAVVRLTDDEKDVEIILLRQQLRIVERKQQRGPWIPRWQKVPTVGRTGSTIERENK